MTQHPDESIYRSHHASGPTQPGRPRVVILVTVLGLVTILGVGLVVGALWLVRRDAPTSAALPSAPAVTTPAPVARTAAPAPRVTPLMARLGCRGALIGTQLYSRETGRCTLSGAEITLATFASDQLRDQWVAAAGGFGGTLVAGPGWAAMVDSPDVAVTVARKLGGDLR